MVKNGIILLKKACQYFMKKEKNIVILLEKVYQDYLEEYHRIMRLLLFKLFLLV